MITKNVTYSEKEEKKKNPKNITTLVCFALSSWDVWNWQKGKTGERMVTGKKFMCDEEDTSPTTAFFINMQITSCEDWVNAWKDSKHSKQKKKNRLSLKRNRNWSNMFGTQISQHDYIQKRIQTQLTKREFVLVIMLISLILHDLICFTDAAVFRFEG